MKKTVSIMIPKRCKGEEERFFACNGRRYLVKCGVMVDVPCDIAEVYFNSVAQRASADRAIDNLAVK